MYVSTVFLFFTERLWKRHLQGLVSMWCMKYATSIINKLLVVSLVGSFLTGYTMYLQKFSEKNKCK